MKTQDIIFNIFPNNFLSRKSAVPQLNLILLDCVNLLKLEFLFLRFDIPVWFSVRNGHRRMHKAWKAEVKYNINFHSAIQCSLVLLQFTQVITDLVARICWLRVAASTAAHSTPFKIFFSFSKSWSTCMCSSESSMPASSTAHWHHWSCRFGGGKRQMQVSVCHNAIKLILLSFSYGDSTAFHIHLLLPDVWLLTSGPTPDTEVTALYGIYDQLLEL